MYSTEYTYVNRFKLVYALEILLCKYMCRLIMSTQLNSRKRQVRKRLFYIFAQVVYIGIETYVLVHTLFDMAWVSTVKLAMKSSACQKMHFDVMLSKLHD